jgi:microcystin degradation protein MlrC
MVPPRRRYDLVEADNADRQNWSRSPKGAPSGPDTLAPMKLRVFGGGIWTETNVFSPMPTGLREFAVARPEDGPSGLERTVGGTAFTRFAELAAAQGHEYVQGTFAVAAPAGLTTRATYESLRDTLLREVADALPLDCVLLSLHGAMAADGYEDCETDMVARIRELVGTAARIGVLLDPHCDLPTELLELTDVVITYKEYPHVDIEERAVEVAGLTLRAAAGEIQPCTAAFDCRMMGVYPTGLEPMRTFVDKLKSAERRPGVLSVSLGHGFPWGDTRAMGAKLIVIADGRPEEAESLAEELGREFFALRREVSLTPLSMEAALDRALAPGAKRPVVIADIADNAGGGAPSDSTFVLEALLERKVENAVVALLWDPIVVRQAFAAGVGSRLAVRIGGKMGPSSGTPLDLSVQVRALVPDLVQRWPQTSGYLDSQCGDCACLTCDGVDIVVSTMRVQVLGLEVYTAFGIDPAERDVIVAKSSNHFRAALEPVAGEILYMSTPGALNFDFASIPYRHVDTNKYPFVDDPWR